MNNEEAKDLKSELARLIDEYAKPGIDNEDTKALKQIQEILKVASNAMDDDIQDIERARLRYRTAFMAFILRIISEQKAAIFQMIIKEEPIGFSIETDLIEEDLAGFIKRKINQSNNPRVIRGWNLYETIKIEENGAKITFRPKKSSS